MIAAINYLNTFENYKIIVFGEIGELGKFSKQIHLKLPNIYKKFYWYCHRFWFRTQVFEMLLKDNFFLKS